MDMETNSSTLTDLTIVIPTYERPKLLLRQIRYLSKWQVKIQIVDGSKNILSNKIREEIKNYKNMTYYHSNKSYVNRIAIAADRINTRFAMCLAEDDFYLRPGVIDAINALKANPKAVACMGQAIGLDHINNNYYVFKYGNNLQGYSVDQSSAVKRIQHGLSEYRSATSYAVFQTQIFKQIWKSRKDASCIELVEYENAINTYLKGELITVDSVYWVRSFEEPSVTSVIEGSRENDFHSWFHSNRFADERYEFKNRILKSFMNNGKISMQDSIKLYEEIIEKILTKSHNTLIQKNLRSKLFNYLTLRIRLNLFFVLLKQSDLWIKTVRPIINYLLRSKINKHNRKSNLDFKEVKNILRFCKNFRKSAY
jgi:glycosyltransferase domain-containing protein